MVECRTPEREVGGSIPTAAVLCPWARHFTPRKYWLITQEAVAPSRHDWKIVDWDVKPQHKQTKPIKTSISLSICPVWSVSPCCKFYGQLRTQNNWKILRSFEIQLPTFENSIIGLVEFDCSLLWEIFADATFLLLPNKNIELYSPKGPENIRITLNLCRIFRADTQHSK